MRVEAAHPCRRPGFGRARETGPSTTSAFWDSAAATRAEIPAPAGLLVVVDEGEMARTCVVERAVAGNGDVRAGAVNIAHRQAGGSRRSARRGVRPLGAASLSMTRIGHRDPAWSVLPVERCELRARSGLRKVQTATSMLAGAAFMPAPQRWVAGTRRLPTRTRPTTTDASPSRPARRRRGEYPAPEPRGRDRWRHKA